MSENHLREAVPRETVAEIEDLFDQLWPVHRSITGVGARKTHDLIEQIVPLERKEIPSGTKVFDWSIPKEWVVRSAHLTGPDGGRVLDASDNNLHLVNYSAPFSGFVSKEVLEQHLYSIPEMPDAIPYVTTYYEERWGFCLSHTARTNLADGDYRVEIDTAFIDGSLTLSDAVLPGSTDAEVLISTYTCHPSLANNELSGPLVAAFLYRRLAALESRRLTYRFVFAPETIGALAYLSLQGEHLKSQLVAGYILTCIGNRSPLKLKHSRRGDTFADRAGTYVLDGVSDSETMEFSPNGSDERQYCSPGFNLPVCVLTRDLATYPEYHTSRDDKSVISFVNLAEAIDAAFDICCVLDHNIRYRNNIMHGEPFLSRHALQSTIGAKRAADDHLRAIKWVLNLSDGDHDLLTIARRSGISFWTIAEVAAECAKAGLVSEVNQS